MTSRTAFASPLDSASFSNPANFQKFFRADEINTLKNTYTLPRETIPIGQPGKSCETNLFLGFFFDGTRNNYAESEKAQNNTYTNVARLFDAYPGQTIGPAALPPTSKWPDEGAYPNYFRIYTPGVGTPFDEVSDTGKGTDRTAGAAVALWGERRLAWALAQAINSVHRFFEKKALLTAAETLALAKQIDLDRRSLKDSPRYLRLRDGTELPANTKAHLERALANLHAKLKHRIPRPGTSIPENVGAGIVKTIYVSAFGFSRGATAARAFVNWFLALCELDARMLGRVGPTLCGFPVQFDFLGLFDTVASVGLASSVLVADGHGAWADAEVSLRIAPGVKCTHLVAAHEVRRSFPLDSISVNGVVPDGCQEIVFPGVHSDVGGGYVPKEQGRGEDAEGTDMASRIPLAVMYREARLNGVPLKLERAAETAKRRFRIATTTLDAFNAYVRASEAYAAAHPRTDTRPLRAIMRTQMELAILWRKSWAGRVAEMESVRRARQVDVNDLIGADEEFVNEVSRFGLWQGQKTRVRAVCSDAVLGTCIDIEEKQVPGLDSERFNEWEDIARFWSRGGVDVAIARYLEGYVHDSRAWFKTPLGWESDEVEDKLKEWVRRYEIYKAQEQMPLMWMGPFVAPPPQPPFSAEEESWIKQYRATGKVPPMKTQGREPFEMGAGYLRFRRIYAGGDSLRITRLAPSRGTTEFAAAGASPGTVQAA